jgi:hypothetical protein
MRLITAILDKVGSFARWGSALVEQARHALQRAMCAIAAGRQQVGPAVREALEFLPFLSEALEALLKELRGGTQGIQKAGYGFAIDHMRVSFVLWAGSLPPSDAPKIIRRQVLAWTRSEVFERQLESLFTSSRTHRRHWRGVRQNLAAHQRRLYVPATRSTLSDIEGVFGDGLIVQGRAWGVRGKMYRAISGRALLKNGKTVTNERTRPQDRQEMVGLKALVEWSGLRRDAAARVMADLLHDRVHPERNRIIHGRWTTFGTAARSTQMLLVLWVVAYWVAGLERQQGQAAIPRLN